MACMMLWFSQRLIYKLQYDNKHLSLPPCLDRSAMSVPCTVPQDPLCPVLPSVCFQALLLSPASQTGKQIYFPSVNFLLYKKYGTCFSCIANVGIVIHRVPRELRQPHYMFLHCTTWEIFCFSKSAPRLHGLSSPGAGMQDPFCHQR